MNIKELRERANLYLYGSKSRVLGILSFLNVLVSLTALSILIIYYGFKLTPESKNICFTILEVSFGFYILRYALKFIYDFNPREFIRNNWFEGIIVMLLLIEGISYNFFDQMLIESMVISWGFEGFGAFSIIFVQLFVFIIIISNLFKDKKFKPWLKIHPGWLFTISIAL
ncbi:MAG: hypothetical protein AB8B56_01950, partial [Crocinitomicaceae bacterium]